MRLGDSSPGGRLRLDAVARYLQDVSDDDTRDAGLRSASWVVRRTVIRVSSFPVYLEPLAMRTWCSGIGARWAERRTVIVGEHGGAVDAATLWVHIDPVTMKPARLPDQFVALFGGSALGRHVSARLTLDPPPVDALGAVSVSWTPRFADFDVLGHVNNAISWALLEEMLSGRRDLRAPMQAVVEHGGSVDRGAEVTPIVVHRADAFDSWLVDGAGRALVSMKVRVDPVPGQPVSQFGHPQDSAFASAGESSVT